MPNDAIVSTARHAGFMDWMRVVYLVRISPAVDSEVIGATNHPDALDTAAIRGGRLGFHVEAGLPGPDESRRLVLGWFERRNLSPETEGFDLEGFVLAHEGRSSADLLHHLEEWANQRAARLMQRPK